MKILLIIPFLFLFFQITSSASFCDSCNIIHRIENKTKPFEIYGAKSVYPFKSSKNDLAFLVALADRSKGKLFLAIIYCDEPFTCQNSTLIYLNKTIEFTYMLSSISVLVYDDDNLLISWRDNYYGQQLSSVFLYCDFYCKEENRQVSAVNSATSKDLMVISNGVDDPVYGIVYQEQTLWKQCLNRQCSRILNYQLTMSNVVYQHWYQDDIKQLRGILAGEDRFRSRYTSYMVFNVTFSGDPYEKKLLNYRPDADQAIGITKDEAKNAPILYYSNYNDHFIMLCQGSDTNCTYNTTFKIPVARELSSVDFIDVTRVPADQKIIIAIYSSTSKRLNIIHCFDEFCHSNWNQVYPIENRFQSYFNMKLMSFTSHALLVLTQGQDNFIGLFPICGPYIRSVDPTELVINGEHQVLNINGYGFCNNNSSKCYINGPIRIDGTFDIFSESISICSFNKPQLLGNYTLFMSYNVGPKTVYSQYDNNISILWKEVCPANNTCNHHGQCNMTARKCDCNNGYYGTACEIDSAKNGYTFITICFAIFIIFFLIILFIRIKYGNKKVKRFKVPHKIRGNIANFLVILDYPFATMQFSIIGLNLQTQWSRYILKATSASMFDFQIYNFVDIDALMRYLFWSVFGVTIVWILFTIPILVRIKKRRLINVLRAKSRFCKNIYTPGFLIIIPWASFLMISVSKTLLGSLSCNYFVNQGQPPRMRRIADIVCWESEHIQMLIASIAVFAIYYPLLVNIYPPLQQCDKSLDIKFTNRFLYYLALLKIVLVAIDSLLFELELIRTVSTTLIAIIVFAIHMEMAPCNIKSLNTVGNACYFGAVIAGICSFWSYFVNVDNLVPFIVMVSSLGALFVGTLLILIFGPINFKKISDVLDAFEDVENTDVYQSSSDSSNNTVTEKDPMINKHEE